ncbi:phospholipase D family protein [Stenotrophomonas acidaminiphila]|uniref:phospholipase D family protein n=1 Tax=Stenotrophomonas acidaminiphila TaxID=128780 RepID=UPI0028A64AE8|nr:phospholipase D family protein [Stenotrophomonas acidaminiphila]
MEPSPSRGRRLLRLCGRILAALLLLVASGLLLGDWLTPRAVGEPSTALPPRAGQTALDRALEPQLAAHPGRSGAAYLVDGLEAFAARSVVTRQAGRSLDLQYYIWHDDMVGHLLVNDVYAAAARGVRVRLLLDDMNAKGLDAQLLALDAHPRIEVRLYNPFRNREGLWRLVEMVQRVFSINHRMHNKAWIADGRVAIVGGRNIGAEYFDAREDVNFRDLDLLLAGPAASEASAIFDAFWNSPAAVPIAALAAHSERQLDQLVSRAALDARREEALPYLQRLRERLAGPYVGGRLPLHWTGRLQVHSDPPLKHRDNDRGDWLVTRLGQELGQARHKTLLISPYFVPGDSGTGELLRQLADGVQVGIVTNSLAANDVAAVHSGYMHYRLPLLRGGANVYELKSRGSDGGRGSAFGSSGASLHTKAIVVDDRRGFVGSFNLDPRSAYLNTEMGVLFDDPVLAAQLREEYLRLSGAELSYYLYLDSDGNLRWLDRARTPPAGYVVEPDTTWLQRATARVISWLPLESQL